MAVRKYGKFVVVAGMIVVVLLILRVSLNSILQQSQGVTTDVAPQAAPSIAPTARPTASASPGASPSPRVEVPIEGPPPAHVVAAVTSVDILSAAQFLPPRQMYPFIEKLAVPDQQASLKNAFASSGPYMAQIWGYAGTEDAKTKAFYNIRTERYKVLSKDADDAVISLYAITHWVTAANEEYRVPSLSSVKMRLVGKNWLYVQAETPPANQLPQLPAQQLEYAELVGLYQPLLKGYSFYDPPEL